MAEISIENGSLKYTSENVTQYIPALLLSESKINVYSGYVAVVLPRSIPQDEMKIYPTANYNTIAKILTLINICSGLATGNCATQIQTSGTDTYIAIAPTGSSTASAVWQAKKIDTNGNKTWADGNLDYDNIATSLSTLTYL